jgi:phosphoribosylaminoimidazole carboxylase PurE protein
MSGDVVEPGTATVTEAPAVEPELVAQVEADLQPTPADVPQVGIIMGSANDQEVMAKAGEILDQAEIRWEMKVMSAHRDPEMVAEYCKGARGRGLRVIIAGAGLSAALPGVAAAHSDLPVIGVPLSSRLTAAGGLDAILSIVQMPPGVPVASVGLDNARNAGHLAVRILSA